MWLDRWTRKKISDALDAAVERYGDREAFVFSNGRLTFRQLAQQADQAARAFLAIGVARGERVAIWMASYSEWAPTYFGLARIGAVMVPVNTRYRPAEIEYVMRKAQASVLVYRNEAVGGKDYAAILRELCPELATSQAGTGGFARLPDLRRVIEIGQHSSPRLLPYDRFLAGAQDISPAKLEASAAAVDGEDIALIQFTSGTTAFPKGAQLYQTAMLRAAHACGCAIAVDEDDRFFSPQPLYHAGGSISIMLSPIVSGCTVVIQPYFNAVQALSIMAAEHCTVTMGHQPHFVEYMAQPPQDWRRLGIRRAFIFANAEFNRLVSERLDIPYLLSPLGMTETHVAGVACNMDDSRELRLSTVGRPMSGVELEVRDPSTGQAVPPGEIGELCYRGWCVMRGYAHDPERTAETIDQNGWLHSGDLAILGEDGYVRLKGRIKEMVRVGGENVASAEVEACLIHHPDVKQAIVVGRPDTRLGEVCVAFVEPRAGTRPTEDELLAFCRRELASFKVPREVRFVGEWPMSGTGKIQKFVLAEQVKQAATTPPDSSPKSSAP